MDKFTVAGDTGNNAGWGGSSIGLDHTNTSKLVRSLYVSIGTVGLRWNDITLDGSGIPTSAAGHVNLTGSTGMTDPRVMVRVNDIDNVSATRLIVKDVRASGGASNNVNRWTPFNTSNAAVAAEQWEAASGLQTFGGFYDSTEKVMYALNSNGVIKYESGDSYWSSTSMTSQRWVGHSWYDSVGTSSISITNKALTSNVATLTTSGAHGYHAVNDIGKWIEIRGVDSTFNGHYQITSVPTTTTFTYAKTASNVTSVAATGTASMGTYETQLSPIASVSLKKRAAMNVTVGTIPYAVGEFPDKARVYVAAGTTMPTLTTTVSTSWKLREEITYPDSSVVVTPLASPSGDRPNNTATNTFTQINSPSEIRSSTGNSFWKGDDTAQFYQLILNAGNDASTGAGNKPALRIGNIAGIHMRLDGNEIIAMDNDTTQGNLFLNSGGYTIAANSGGQFKIGSSGSLFKQIRSGLTTDTTNASGELGVSHGGGTAPDHIVWSLNDTGTTATQSTLAAVSSTGFTIQCRNSTGAVTASGVSKNIRWIAIWV